MPIQVLCILQSFFCRLESQDLQLWSAVYMSAAAEDRPIGSPARGQVHGLSDVGHGQVTAESGIQSQVIDFGSSSRPDQLEQALGWTG